MRGNSATGTLTVVAIAFAILSGAMSEHAEAQVYQCPPGYYYDPSYGCLPLSYFYGPPYSYVYPDFGFDFFYGGGYRGRGFGRGGVAPRGGGADGFGRSGVAPRSGGARGFGGGGGRR